MIKRIPATVAFLAVALVFGACFGGGSSDKTATPVADEGTPIPTITPAAEDTLARSMLLTQADFPSGWTYAPPQPGDEPGQGAPEPLQRCFTSFPGQTGHAVGGSFSESASSDLSIIGTVYVFDNDANAALAGFAISQRAQCFADVIGDGIDIDPTFSLGASHTEPLSADAFGATRAVRLVETQVFKDEDPPSTEEVFDIVIVVQGRVVYEVDGFQPATAIDPAVLKDAVEKAIARVKQN